MSDEPLVIVPVPPLVSVLLWHEQRKGAALTEEEVLDISGKAICITMPESVAARFVEERGVKDVSLENPWADWIALRSTNGLGSY